MTNSAPMVSVVIVNWNTVDLLTACLHSLDSIVPDCTIEIIVIDNASTDGSPEFVEKNYPTVKLIRNSSNCGFAVANNQGISVAEGEYLLLLNSDTEVSPSAISDLAKYLSTHPNVGIVGADLRNPDNTHQYCFDLLPLPALQILRQNLFGAYERFKEPSEQTTPESPASAPFEVGWVLGAALMIRRSVLDQIGLLDEHFFMYAEELDLCYRAKKNGWKVVHVPGACIMHLNGGSSQKSKHLQQKLFRMRQKSLEKFYRKHYGVASEQLLRLIHLKQRIF